jgi:hypothetical protein
MSGRQQGGGQPGRGYGGSGGYGAQGPESPYGRPQGNGQGPGQGPARNAYQHSAYEQQPPRPAAPGPMPRAAASPTPPPAAGGGAHGGAHGGATRRDNSPLIAPGLTPAALATVLAALLAVTAPLGKWPLAVAVLILQAVTAAGWFRLNGMWPARQGIGLAFLAGLAADAGLLLAGGGHASAVLIGTLGVWCLLTLALHLRDTSSPDERLYALTAAFTATLLTVVASGHLLALFTAGAQAVTVGMAGVAVATLVRALPLPAYVSPLLALLAGAGAGAGAGRLAGLHASVGALPPDGSGALLGLVAGGFALIGLRVASYDYPSRFVHMTAGVALPLTLAAPAVYLLGRAVAS